MTTISLGAPGLRHLPPEPVRALTDVRTDVCAFVGVAPRGPARVPALDASWAARACREGATVTPSVAVAVESWDEYVRAFGAFEGPGLLPYAVASFFENGGVRAYVVRVVHDYRDDAKNAAGVARARLHVAGDADRRLKALASSGDTSVWLRARDEGAWGNALRTTLAFRTRPLALPPSAFTTTGVVLDREVDVTAGTLLRLDHGGGVRSLVRVARVWEAWSVERPVRERRATFDAPAPLGVVRAEVVEGVLEVDDGTGGGRRERHEALGLSPEHPRWLARVVAEESALLLPADVPANRAPETPTDDAPLAPNDSRRAWLDGRELVLDADLPSYETEAFTGGADRYADLAPEDFFDDGWVPGDECPGRGVHALVHLDDLSLVAAPDLYSPRPLVARDPIVDDTGAGPCFAPCVRVPNEVPNAPLDDLDGLRLDPTLDLDRIVGLQRRLVELAEQQRCWVALLDVPPGLEQRRILAWRDALSSMFAAAYHPWLRVSRPDDRRDAAIDVPPSAVAAGIVARRALAFGVHYGPANELAGGVFDVTDRVSPARHDVLHPLGVNVFLRESDGVRLTAARTLSRDPWWRQLSVRRLVTMLERVLLAQMQWAAFEPNDGRLRSAVRHQLEAYLRQLFAAGAFAGARAEDAYFVRCDEETNPPQVVDLGRLVAHVGVAPAEPLEFIVIRLARDGDGTLRASSAGGA